MEESSHSKVSNCDIGCRVPFLSFFADLIAGAAPLDPDAESTALLSKMLVSKETSSGRIIASFEELIDKFGIECVVFLPSADASQPTGKKCILRSKLGDGKAEIRLRLEEFCQMIFV
jgi:hypothetical protein